MIIKVWYTQKTKTTILTIEKTVYKHTIALLLGIIPIFYKKEEV